MMFDLELIDTVFKRCEDRLRTAVVFEDSSPVMAEPGSYLAKIEHPSGRIVLNAHYLRKLTVGRRESERRFLIFHELAHAELKSDRILRGGIKAEDEEAFCDAVGERAKCLE